FGLAPLFRERLDGAFEFRFRGGNLALHLRAQALLLGFQFLHLIGGDLAPLDGCSSCRALRERLDIDRYLFNRLACGGGCAVRVGRLLPVRDRGYHFTVSGLGAGVALANPVGEFVQERRGHVQLRGAPFWKRQSSSQRSVNSRGGSVSRMSASVQFL